MRKKGVMHRITLVEGYWIWSTPQGIVHGPAALHERLDGRYDEIRHGQVFRVVFSRYVTFPLCNVAGRNRIYDIGRWYVNNDTLIREFSHIEENLCSNEPFTVKHINVAR